MVTINDVAKRCGVVKSTVSNALTGKKYVSPELKQKILDACKELDFQPNFYASTLARGNTNIIALVLEEDSNEKFRGFYSDLIVACLRTAARHGGTCSCTAASIKIRSLPCSNAIKRRSTEPSS